MDPSRPTPVDIASLAAANSRAELLGAAESLLRLSYDHDFLDALAAMMLESHNTTQEGPLLLQQPGILARVAEIRRERLDLYEGLFATALRSDRYRRFDLRVTERQLDILDQQQPTMLAFVPAVTLLAQDFPPLRMFVDEILAEGLTLLAGKPKKGKSYLALDMALSIAVGRQAFWHFPTEKARVLYVSLEDGQRRIKRRLLQIQSNLATPQGLTFLFSFPRLGAGALEALTQCAQTHEVIIIDVLARILPPQTNARKSLSEYQELTDVLGPVQQLAQEKRLAIVLIDHVRKASADDAGDSIMGSQGKFGVSDHALIYGRKGEEKDGVLTLLSRDLEEEKFVLTMVSGHLEFLGKGESYEMDSEQNRVIKILEEEHRPMGIQEIMRAMGIGDEHYRRFRMMLYRLYENDRVGRTQKRGLYTLYSHDRDYD